MLNQKSVLNQEFIVNLVGTSSEIDSQRFITLMLRMFVVCHDFRLVWSLLLLSMSRRWKNWHLPTQTTCGVYLSHAQSVWHWADSPLPVLCPLTSPLWNLTPGTIIIPQLLAPNLWPGLNVRRCVVSWRAQVSPQMSGERVQWRLSTTLNGPWFPVQGRHNSHHYVSPKNQNGLGSRFPQGRYQLCWNSRVFIMSETGSKSEQLKI